MKNIVRAKKLIKASRDGHVLRYLGPQYAKLWLAALILCGVLTTPAIASAATLISQGFIANGNLPAGSLVSLQKDSSDYVDSSTINTANNLLGVVIDSGSSQVSISSGQNNQVQVATNGVESVLVSDISGNIAVGDPLTASPISGVAMKATSNAKVVGIAQDAFPNSTASQQTYTDKSGKHSVMLGTVPVLVNVAYYYKQPDKTLIPPALQNIANSLAGKTVNSLPILLSIGIFIVTLVIVVSIIYSMIHSSIISVGRNPMAQAAVYRNVVQLSALVVVILGVAVASIYMVLTRL